MHHQAPLAELTDAQRQAVDWQDGPLLVLAAPGSGRTHVLARRIVRLLDASRDRRFRILALIDEFQNTGGARYALLRRMAGRSFREICVAAVDERTTAEETGAHARPVDDFVRDFACTVIRLPGGAAGRVG